MMMWLVFFFVCKFSQFGVKKKGVAKGTCKGFSFEKMGPS
jgi:hypothetical protein